MPAYHSKFEDVASQGKVACGCALLPIKSPSRGPIPAAAEDAEDIIDEALFYFRANVLFRNFEVKGSADRTLILVTLYIQMGSDPHLTYPIVCVQCLKEGEKHETKAEGAKALSAMALKQYNIPGDPGFSLTAIFQLPAKIEEADLFRAYFKWIREETNRRVVERLYNADGTKNKWWQFFSKRKFMNKELK